MYAAIIGEVIFDHPAQVIFTSDNGGKRMLPMLTENQLPRVG